MNMYNTHQDLDEICKKIYQYVTSKDQDQQFKAELFNKEQNAEIKYSEEENKIWILISNLSSFTIEDHNQNQGQIKNKDQINEYIQNYLRPQIKRVLEPNSEENIKKSNDNDEFNIDLHLLRLKRDNPNGIDTNTEGFEQIKKEYKSFFVSRCEKIINNKSEKSLFKDDPELREFMIRHNRFVPLFNLRHISADLLEQMATRFSRMKESPDEIKKESDKIELI